MTSLKKVYDTITAGTVDETLVRSLIPTTVFILTTRCTSVQREYVNRFKIETRKALEVKDVLLGILRQVVDNNTTAGETDPFLDDSLLNQISESYQRTKINRLVDLIIEKVRLGWRAGIGVRAGYRKGFRDYVSGAYDVVLTESSTGSAVIYRMSRSRENAPDEMSVLLYVLLVMYSKGVNSVEYVQYPVHDLGRSRSYTLKSEEITEPVGDTVLKLITAMGKNRVEQGRHCESCIHSDYCPVLKDIIRQEVDNAQTVRSEDPGRPDTGKLSGGDSEQAGGPEPESSDGAARVPHKT